MVVLQVTIFASLFGRSACVLQRADKDSKIIVQSSPLNADSVLHRSTLVEQSLPLFGTAVLTTLHAPRSGARSPLLQPQSSPLNADSILHHSTLVEQSLPLFGTAVLTTLHAPRSAVCSPLLHPISLHTIALLRASSAKATTPSSQPPPLSPPPTISPPQSPPPAPPTSQSPELEPSLEPMPARSFQVPPEILPPLLPPPRAIRPPWLSSFSTGFDSDMFVWLGSAFIVRATGFEFVCFLGLVWSIGFLCAHLQLVGLSAVHARPPVASTPTAAAAIADTTIAAIVAAEAAAAAAATAAAAAAASRPTAVAATTAAYAARVAAYAAHVAATVKITPLPKTPLPSPSTSPLQSSTLAPSASALPFYTPRPSPGLEGAAAVGWVGPPLPSTATAAAAEPARSCLRFSCIECGVAQLHAVQGLPRHDHDYVVACSACGVVFDVPEQHLVDAASAYAGGGPLPDVPPGSAQVSRPPSHGWICRLRSWLQARVRGARASGKRAGGGVVDLLAAVERYLSGAARPGDVEFIVEQHVLLGDGPLPPLEAVLPVARDPSTDASSLPPAAPTAAAPRPLSVACLPPRMASHRRGTQELLCAIIERVGPQCRLRVMAAASLAPHRVAFGSTVERELHDTLTKLVGDHVMARARRAVQRRRKRGRVTAAFNAQRVCRRQA